MNLTGVVDALLGVIADWRLRRIAARRMRELFPQSTRVESRPVPPDEGRPRNQTPVALPCRPVKGRADRWRMIAVVVTACVGLSACGPLVRTKLASAGADDVQAGPDQIEAGAGTTAASHPDRWFELLR